MAILWTVKQQYMFQQAHLVVGRTFLVFYTQMLSQQKCYFAHATYSSKVVPCGALHVIFAAQL
jgi:hypothetical protein